LEMQKKKRKNYINIYNIASIQSVYYFKRNGIIQNTL